MAFGDRPRQREKNRIKGIRPGMPEGMTLEGWGGGLWVISSRVMGLGKKRCTTRCCRGKVAGGYPQKVERKGR